jgi:hypothetical protein
MAHISSNFISGSDAPPTTSSDLSACGNLEILSLQFFHKKYPRSHGMLLAFHDVKRKNRWLTKDIIILHQPKQLIISRSRAVLVKRSDFSYDVYICYSYTLMYEKFHKRYKFANASLYLSSLKSYLKTCIS